jgi:hypothetical protein
MAAGPEAKVKNKLRKWIEKEFPGSWVYMAPGGRFGRKGVPDLLCCIEGAFVAIEVKATTGMKATPFQQEELRLIVEANGISILLDGWNEVILHQLKREILLRAKRIIT